MDNKTVILAALIFLGTAFPSAADEILFRDGDTTAGKILSVDENTISYIPLSSDSSENLRRDEVESFIYDDGTEVKLNDGNRLSANVIDPMGVVWKARTKPLILPFLLRFDFKHRQGGTSVNIYDNKDKTIASGDADLRQYGCDISYEPLKTDFFITPEIGYFYRNISVRDYSKTVANENYLIKGYIPGTVKDIKSGEEIDSAKVSSLKYNADFHSVYADIKAGAHLVYGNKNIDLILNPYVSAGLAEYRKSIFEFKLGTQKEKFETGFGFSFISSYAFGCEAGAYFPGVRTGFKLGYDRRYLTKFDISRGVKFLETYEDETGIMRIRENSVKSSDIGANLITFDVFVFI